MSIPEPKIYKPRSAPPILLKSTRSSSPTSDPRWRKVIIHRFTTENGAFVFVLGTYFGGIIKRDAEDVPLSKIHDYITPTELRCFEQKDFERERERELERERLRLLQKPRGRPRKNALPNGTPNTTTPKAAPKTPAGGYGAFRNATGEGKKRGRPLGWRKNTGSPTNIVQAPSFNGPQPTGQTKSPNEPSTREQSLEDETPLDIQARTGVYSMVAASGLIPIDSETEPEASRDITPLHPTFEDAEFEQPSSKRQKPNDNATPFQSSNGTRGISVTSSPTPPPDYGQRDDERKALITRFKGASKRQRSSSQPSSESLLSTTKACPTPPVSHDITSSQPPPVQSTPSRQPKRTSLTPHFPGNRWWQPNIKGGRKRIADVLSPSSNHEKVAISAKPPPPSTSRLPPASATPSTTTSIKSLAPTQRSVFRDITSYFVPIRKIPEVVKSSQPEPSDDGESESDSHSESGDEDTPHQRPPRSILKSLDTSDSSTSDSFMSVIEPTIHKIVDRVDPRLRDLPSHISDSVNGDEEETDHEILDQVPETQHRNSAGT